MKEPYLVDVWMTRPWWPIAAKITKAVFKAGEYVFFLLAGGLLLASMSQVIGFVGFLFPKHYNPSAVQHTAWVAGVLLFAIGRPMGWVTTNWFKGGDSSHVPQSTSTPAKEVTSVWGTAGLLGLIGFFIGIAATTLLVLAWFSISVSPFSPENWHHSVHASDGYGSGFESSNPMLIRLSWMPCAILTGLGLLGGLILGVVEKVRGAAQESREDKFQ